MRFLMATVMAAGLTGPLAAQDYNWSGLYLGAHGGYSWADIDHPEAAPHPAGPPRPSLEGGLVGGQIGYNFQFDRLVLGVEGDYSFSGMEETLRDGNAITQSYDIDGLASVRGRLGLAIGHWLPYLTGGYAWGQSKFNQTCPDPNAVPFGHCNVANGFAPYNITKSETVEGWVYGGGIEAAIAPNWSLRGEWLRYDMDAQAFNLGKTPSGKDLGSKTLEHDIDVLRLGVNFHFGEQTPPVGTLK